MEPQVNSLKYVGRYHANFVDNHALDISECIAEDVQLIVPEPAVPFEAEFKRVHSYSTEDERCLSSCGTVDINIYIV